MNVICSKKYNRISNMVFAVKLPPALFEHNYFCIELMAVSQPQGAVYN